MYHDSIGVLAGEKDYGSEDIKKFVEFIDNEYLAEVLVDNLPGVINVQTTDGMTYYEHGYPVGGVLVQNGSNDALGYALNNHLDFKIFYNDKEVKDSVVIVGFEIVHRRYFYSFFLMNVVFVIILLRKLLKFVRKIKFPP